MPEAISVDVAMSRVHQICGSLLLALIVPLAKSHAQSNPTPRDPWPKEIAIPQIIDEEQFLPQIAGGEYSANRKVIGIHMRTEVGAPFVCSGVLLRRDVVLTAAHCTCGMTRFAVTNDPKMVGAKWYAAKVLSIFGRYNCVSGPLGGNDLALLKVTVTVMPTDVPGEVVGEDYSLITAIDFQSRWARTPPRQMRAEGYGFRGNDSGSLGGRRFAEISVDSIGCVESWIQWTGCSVLYEFILGLHPTGGKLKDTCSGDSGGPVFSGENLVGIVSRGVPTAQPFSLGKCGAGGIYTHLGRLDVMSWLNENAGRTRP